MNGPWRWITRELAEMRERGQQQTRDADRVARAARAEGRLLALRVRKALAEYEAADKIAFR